MKAQEIHEGVNYHLEKKIPLHESVYRLGSDEYFNMFTEARKLYTEGKLKSLHWFDEEILRDTQLGEWVNIKGIGRVPLDMIIDEDNHAIAEASNTGTYRDEENNIDVKWQKLHNGYNSYFDIEAYRDGKRVQINNQQADHYIYMIKQDIDESVNEAKYQGKKVELSKPKRGGSKKFYVYTKNKKGNVVKVSFGAKDGGGNLAVKLKDPKARKAFADRHNCEQKNDKTKPGYWSCRLPRYAKSLGLSGGGTWW